MRASAIVVVLVCVFSALTGCGGDSQQKMLTEGARSAREAASEVNTVRLISQQLLDHKLWSPSATSMVKSSEKTLEKVSSSFTTRQPKSDAARRTYDHFAEALSTASDAVGETRIAIVNGDLSKVREQVTELEKLGEQLDQLGESAQ